MSIECHFPPIRAQVIHVIHVPAMRGNGSKEDPERLIHLYFSLDGELLSCHDELNGPPDSYIVPDTSTSKDKTDSIGHQEAGR